MLRTSYRLSKPDFGLFINGKEFFPGPNAQFPIENPATGKFILHCVQASKDDIYSTIAIAHDRYVQGVWSRADARDRSKVLFSIANSIKKNITRLADLEVAQTGRTKREMTAQLMRVPEWFDYYGSLVCNQEGSTVPYVGRHLSYVKRVPWGVCGLLTPWNQPILSAVKKIAPALACGNSLVVQPSELAPASIVELAKLCSESGLPGMCASSSSSNPRYAHRWSHLLYMCRWRLQRADGNR